MPQAGHWMIEAAFRDFPEAAPANSVLIGDSFADMECGRRAGMATVYIEASSGGEVPDRKSDAEAAKRIADVVAGSLGDAVRLLG